MAVAARAATAAAAAVRVLPPTLLAAYSHAAALSSSNSSEENHRANPLMAADKNALFSSNAMFMYPYLNPFMQVSGNTHQVTMKRS